MNSTRTVRPTPHAMIELGAVKISVSDFASQGNAVLGMRDSGKSYTATTIAEQLMTAGIPIVAFDPIGVWRNLRHAGTGPGFEIILVGDDGDAPIDVKTAEGLMLHAMETGASIIFDLYSMQLHKSDWRVIVERCVNVLLYKNKSHGLRHIFLEEAAEFVPQMVNREYGNVYATIEKLVRMGGNAMLGITLINQRAEQLNKAVLELCACLFLHNQKGRLSLTALGKWLDFGDKKQSKLIIKRLPVLEQGECFVWAGGEDAPKFTKIPAKRTFHPNRREHSTPGRAMPSAHLLSGYEAPEKPKPVFSPESPRSKAPGLSAPPPMEPERVEVPVFREGELAALDRLERLFRGNMEEMQKIIADAGVIAKAIDSAVKRGDAVSRERTLPTAVRTAPSPFRGNHKPTGKGPKKILAALMGRHPMRLTFNQVGTICIFTPSTMRTYMPGLKAAGYIDENRDGITLTEEGRAAVGDKFVTIPDSGAELLSFWCQRLNQGEAKILSILQGWGKRGGDMQMLEEQSGYTGSTLRTYLPTLRRNNLIDPTELRIMPEFLT